MGVLVPVVPESLMALLPRQAQCVALLAAEKAKDGRITDGCVYLSYRRIGDVFGLRVRRQIENLVDGYFAALEAVLQAA